MAAFKHSLSLGMNMLELDVHCSKDGEVVIAHDADLSRMCGPEYKDQKICDYNYADLPPFQSQITMHLTPGIYTRTDGEDETFTLLKDLFAVCPLDVIISIDMKDATGEICTRCNDLVKEYNREDVTVWGSMFKEQHEMVQRLNPNVSTFYSFSQAFRVYLWFVLGCLFCCPLPADMFMTTHMTLEQKGRVKDYLSKRGRTGCFINCALAIARCTYMCSGGLKSHLKKRGNGTVVWVVNTHGEFQQMVDKYGDSLDGVMTDMPSNLRTFVD